MTGYRVASTPGLALALACGLSLAAQAGEKPADLIVGRWQGEGVKVKAGKGPDAKEYVEKVTVEFGKDGTFKRVGEGIPEVKHKGVTETGKYAFVSATELELVVQAGDKAEKTRLRVTVTKDELTLTEAVDGGRTGKLKRIK